MQRFLKNIFNAAALFTLSAWILGLIHGPDAKLIALIFFLLSGLIHFLFSGKKMNECWLWSGASKLFVKLEQHPHYRLLLFLSAALVSTILCALKTYSGRYMMFDQGIFNQILWSIGNGLGFHSTIEPVGNHLLVHFSPTLLFAWPISALVNYHPIGLVLTSALCLWGGLYAWIKMVRVHPLLAQSSRNRVETGVLLLIVFLDSIWSNLYWGFHEAHLAFLFLSWGYYFFLKGRFWAAVTLFCLTALSKEQYLLEMGFLGLALSIIDRKSIRKYFIFSLAMFYLFYRYRHWSKSELTLIESELPKSYLLDLFGNYFGYLNVTGVGDLLKKLIFDPFSVFSLWFKNRLNDGSWMFPLSFSMVFGFGFLVRQGKLILLFIGVLPAFMMIYLAHDSKLQDFGLQYVLILWPTLFVLSLPGFAKKRFGVNHAHLYLAMMISFSSGGIDYLKKIKQGIVEVSNQTQLLSKVNEIPPNDSVWSDRLIGSLANRNVVQSPPYIHFFKDQCPDWIIGSEVEVSEWIKLLKQDCLAKHQKAWSVSGAIAYHKN